MKRSQTLSISGAKKVGSYLKGILMPHRTTLATTPASACVAAYLHTCGSDCFVRPTRILGECFVGFFKSTWKMLFSIPYTA